MTLILCNPIDALFVGRNLTEGDVLLPLERVPLQVVICLADRLRPLVDSGAWFDTPDAAYLHQIGDSYRRDFQPRFEIAMDGALVEGKPRCQALTQSYTQCKNSARATYCGRHDQARHLITMGVGEPALAQPNESPLSAGAIRSLEEAQEMIRRAMRRASRFGEILQHGLLGPEDADYVSNLLEQAHEIIGGVISGDRARDATQRSELRRRIQRMVDRIAIANKCEGREIHAAYLRLGGVPQGEMTIEQLKAKVNWLHTTYPDVIGADTREWEPPATTLSGMEPAITKR